MATTLDASTFPAALSLGKEFSTFAGFKAAMRRWAVQAQFTTKYKKCKRQVYVVVCTQYPDCPFRVRAFWKPRIGKVVVTVCIDHHTCVHDAQGISPDSPDSDAEKPRRRASVNRLGYLSEMVPSLLEISTRTRPKDIQDAVLNHVGQPLDYHAAHRVLRLLQKRQEEGERSQFYNLPRLCNLIRMKDPNAVVDLEIDDTGSCFRSMFIAPSISSNAFVHSLPLLEIGKTPCCHAYNMQLLLAVGMDGNGSSTLLAFSLVDRVDSNVWQRFLSLLIRAIPSLAITPFSMIMERLRGAGEDDALQEAIQTMLPRAHVSYCADSLCRLMSVKFGRETADAFYNVATSPPHQFTQKMDVLREMNQLAVRYLDRHWSKEMYAASKSPAPRFGQTSLELVQSVSNDLTDERDKPALEALLGIWQKIYDVRIRRVRRGRPILHGIEHSNFAQNLLSKARETAPACMVLTQRSDKAVVEDVNGTFDVDLVNRQCSCGSFQETLIPCSHAVAVIRLKGEMEETYLAEPYGMNNYLEVYGASMPSISKDEVKALEPAQETCNAPPVSKQVNEFAPLSDG